MMKRRLPNAYSSATHAYSSAPRLCSLAVISLNASHAVSLEAFEEDRQLVADARAKYTRAREMFEEHIRTHGC